MTQKAKVIFLSIILVYILTLIGCSNNRTLDFKEIIEIEFNGLNGNGTISISENEDIYKNGELLKRLYPDISTRKAKNELEDLLYNVSYSLSKETELSNGDEVIITVEYDEDIFKENEIKTANNQFTVKVEGLSDGRKIDVFEGLEVTYSGLSGKGYAIFNSNNCDEFVQKYVTFSCAESNLSNEDIITVSANYSIDEANNQLIIVENETKKFTVSGLKEPVEIDPFDKLEITYTGASPYIKAAVDSTKCDDMINKYITFTIEDDYLRNGDSFTVTASYNEYDSEEYGFKVKRESKTYTVGNQPEYVTSLDGLDLKDLQKEIDDKLAVITAANDGDSSFAGVRNKYHSFGFKSIKEKSHKSSYMISLKTNFEEKFYDTYYKYSYNRYLQCYEYIVNYNDGEQEKVYIVVFVDNIQKNSDGTISWSIELGSKGYSNYDSLINDFVTSEKEFYNVSEIKDKDTKSSSQSSAKSTETSKDVNSDVYADEPLGKGDAPKNKYPIYSASVKTGYLALRKEKEDNDNNIIGKIYNNDEVYAIHQTGTYWYVYAPKVKMFGYVNKDYLVN